MDLNLIFIIIYNVKPTWWNKFNYQLVYLFPLDKSKMLDWNSNYLVKMIVAIFHPIIDIWSTWMWEFFFFLLLLKKIDDYFLLNNWVWKKSWQLKAIFIARLSSFFILASMNFIYSLPSRNRFMLYAIGPTLFLS